MLNEMTIDKEALRRILPELIKSDDAIRDAIISTLKDQEQVEFDIFVRTPPVKTQTIRVKINSVEKATPRVVEPEGS